MSEQILNQILNEIITVNQRLDRIESDQASFKQDVTRRFDGIDQRFDGIDRRFDDIDQRFEGVDRRFDDIDQRFEGVDRRFDRIESDHKTLRDELREFREETRADLQVLKAGQQGIRTEITDRFKETKTELNNHEYSIEILNRRQLKLEADIEQLKNR